MNKMAHYSILFCALFLILGILISCSPSPQEDMLEDPLNAENTERVYFAYLKAPYKLAVSIQLFENGVLEVYASEEFAWPEESFECPRGVKVFSEQLDDIVFDEVENRLNALPDCKSQQMSASDVTIATVIFKEHRSTFMFGLGANKEHEYFIDYLISLSIKEIPAHSIAQ